MGTRRIRNPLVAQKMAASGKYDAVITLGAVIKGATAHFDYVCSEVSKRRGDSFHEYRRSGHLRCLTTDTIEQAIERAGTKAGNKGYDCAVSAIEMANLLKNL